MVTTTKTASEAPKKKPASKHGILTHNMTGPDNALVCHVERAGGGKKKLTEFNKFMQTEMAKLKEQDPAMPHKERYVSTRVTLTLWRCL